MAITATDRGTGGDNSSGASTTVTPGSNLASGSTGVLCFAADNANGASTNFPTSITDSAGNTWTRRVDQTSGSANNNVELGIYSSILTSGLTTSGSIVLTYTAANVTAKAWTLTELVPGTTGNIVLFRNSSSSSSTNQTAPTSSTGAFVSNGDAVIGAIGAESPDTFTGDSDTTNGSWSTHQHTGFGSGTSGMSVSSQTKIVTATGTQSYDPTLTSADISIANVSFAEVPPKTRAIRCQNTAEAATTITATRALAAGSVGVLCVAADNMGTNGDTANLPTAPTDSQGNTWTQRQAGIFDNGAAGAGVEIGIYTSVLSTGLSIGDTITLTYQIANVTAKGWVIFEFSDATAYSTGNVGTGATTGTPSVTTASITNGDYVIGLAGLEGVDSWAADADTSNGSWSTEARATAGSGASAMSLIAQYKKVTAGATQTFNPTCTSGDTMIGWAELTVPSGITNTQYLGFLDFL